VEEDHFDRETKEVVFQHEVEEERSLREAGEAGEALERRSTWKRSHQPSARIKSKKP
jgi:hypothetical protein